MFNRNSATARGGAMARALKGAVPVAAFAVGLAAASPGAATTVILQNGVMDQPRLVTIAGLGQVKATPVQFDGVYGSTPFTNLVAFCVDVYHRITLGTYTPELTYTDDVELTTDSNYENAQALSGGQITQIGRLINYGTAAFNNAPTGTAAQRNARWDELASVQGAIWQVVSGRDVTSTNAGVDAWINNLSGAGYEGFFNAAYGEVRTSFTFLTPLVYPAKPGSQGMGVGAVPEPAAWLLMIGGFGGAGAMLRRRRAVVALAR